MNPKAFLFPKNCGRVSFVVRFIVFFVAWQSGVFLRHYAMELGPAHALGIPVVSVAFLLLLFSFIFLFRSWIYPRVKDVGLHGAFTAIAAVPFVNFAFVFILAVLPSGSFERKENETSRNPEPVEGLQPPSTAPGERG